MVKNTSHILLKSLLRVRLFEAPQIPLSWSLPGIGWGQGVLSQETDGQPQSRGKWQLYGFLPSHSASIYPGVRRGLPGAGRLSSHPWPFSLASVARRPRLEQDLAPPLQLELKLNNSRRAVI